MAGGVRQRALDAARARGQRLGRPPALTPDQVRHARHLLTEPANTVTSIVKLLGVSRCTLYKHIPELATGPAMLGDGAAAGGTAAENAASAVGGPGA